MGDAFFSDRFYYSWGPHTPSLRVESGAIVRVVCPDSDSCLADGTALPSERRQAAEGTELFAGNPLAGPIYVEGATPNDCLAIDVVGIELDRTQGATLLAPNHGLLSHDQLLGANSKSADEQVPKHLYQWRIDSQRQVAEMVNPLGGEPLTVPLRPMIGCLGVCPTWGQSIASLFAGAFGGNLDLPLVEKGATIFLPVFHAGGLVMVGDIHAAQGAGEIVGGAIETSGVATLRFRRIAGRAIPAPRLIAGGNIYAVATEGDLRLAVSTAYARLLEWLANEFALPRWDAYQLLSQAGVLEVGGLSVASCLTVAAGLSIDLLPTACREEIGSWTASAGQ